MDQRRGGKAADASPHSKDWKDAPFGSGHLQELQQVQEIAPVFAAQILHARSEPFGF